MTKMLHVEDLHVYYGSIHALKGVSLEVNEGEIVSLIGANGAGKTTLLAAIMNQQTNKTGHITFLDKNIDSVSTASIVKSGMTLVPEGRRIFPRLSVQDNIMLGSYFRTDKEVGVDLAKVYELFPRMYERRRQVAGTLSGGEQQMLVIGRAIMSRPKVLLLDEPSMGLAPIVVREIFRTIQRLNHDGATILLVEQNANMALRLANRGYVLETGSIVLTGTGRELMVNENVKKAYLGE
jgi:branched-chain amino acid transport system ATP-binding protein